MTAIEISPVVSTLADSDSRPASDLAAVCVFAVVGLAITGLFLAVGFGGEIAQALAQ
jgi:hypothetical protein